MYINMWGVLNVYFELQVLHRVELISLSLSFSPVSPVAAFKGDERSSCDWLLLKLAQTPLADSVFLPLIMYSVSPHVAPGCTWFVPKLMIRKIAGICLSHPHASPARNQGLNLRLRPNAGKRAPWLLWLRHYMKQQNSWYIIHHCWHISLKVSLTYLVSLQTLGCSLDFKAFKEFFLTCLSWLINHKLMLVKQSWGGHWSSKKTSLSILVNSNIH